MRAREKHGAGARATGFAGIASSRYPTPLSITATVKNDTVKLPSDVHLPDGTKVTIELSSGPQAALADNGAESPTLFEVFKDFIGKAEGLSANFAAEHDH